MQTSNYSTSIYIVIDSKVDSNNLSKVYLRILQGKKKDHYLKIKWPRDKFDKVNEKLLPRFPKDVDCDKNNSKILEIKNRLNKLSLDAYIRNRVYTIEDYISVIEKKASLVNFAAFMEESMKREVKQNVIAYETYQKQENTLKKLKLYFGEHIPMGLLTIEKIKEFDAYWRNHGFKNNTVNAYHKIISKYLNQAISKGLIEKNPYEDFRFSHTPGERKALTQQEVKILYQLFEDQTLDYVEHEVLRRFLFSCITGVRISDTHQLSSEHIINNNLKFMPYKTRKLGKTVTIPLPVAALKLVHGRKGKLFVKFADQSINRILKRIAEFAGINSNISYHSARDSFGTIFIELGGDIKSLADLMGHSNTKTTEIYLKMADGRKQKLMNNFDTMFG